jgi:hypothetical protein
MTCMPGTSYTKHNALLGYSVCLSSFEKKTLVSPAMYRLRFNSCLEIDCYV